MRRFLFPFFVLALALVLPSTSPLAADQERDWQAEYAALTDPANGSDAERLNKLFDLAFEHAVEEFPEIGTFLGIPGADNGRWTDGSLAAGERREREGEWPRAVLASIDRDKLEGEDRLNFDLYNYQTERGVEGQRFKGQYMAITQLGGIQQGVAQTLTLMPKFNRRQIDDILSRMRGVPKRIDDTIDHLEKGIETGITPPRITLRAVADQIAAQAVEDPETSPIYQNFANLPDSISADEQEKIRSEARKIIAEQITPAYRKLHKYWVDEYFPATRETIAMADLPDGEAWYAFNVKGSTTTDLTPQEIHDIGLSEVARIRGEMRKIIEQVEFEGGFEEFFEFLRTDPQFYFDTAQELLAEYRSIAKKADPELVKLFGKLPRLPYGVTPVPAYSEQSQTTAYYQPGSLENGRAGSFFANTYDLSSRPKWEMEALTLHEAVPGHHLQIAIAQELEDVPQFRKFGGFTAFTEGWGLYSESLGEEMGFYEDPYSKFGQLTYEMWRAIRLVVDTGMHALGWSRQQAIDFFKENAGKAEHDIIVEVDRYIVWPGQALAYKIGELKIKELRAYAENELGNDFDVRAFHDNVLGNGAVPLETLERFIKEWVAEVKAGSAAGESAGQ